MIAVVDVVNVTRALLEYTDATCASPIVILLAVRTADGTYQIQTLTLNRDELSDPAFWLRVAAMFEAFKDLR